ncbi:protein GRAVITROPIC IN THE LIGHT 1 [Salvia miltiorrhiza]|uniref:protein GRAVITROPIC IN THE LIGHT 1 n=1 Tax=Salvia miltiorrhiza TaxID=226208 RepID=UPI0025ABCBD3|nr:protein GRAVITROPIC IN THE LIGHT 1 [Salvia miltiorrhiza]XP_057772543.1 protein GRAVITROPIC IN THE LIGHT 1 [Salvia miltiorrhiza]
MGLESDKQGMEFAASSKPLKPPANISEIVSKFAKVCKFRSIGVFYSSENVDQSHVYPMISGDNARLLDEESGEDVLFCAKKIFPEHAEVQKSGNLCARVELVQLFDTLLALKIAYVKLQEAHIPYDPEKVRVADEEVMLQIDTLGKIKKAYKEKQLKEANAVSAGSALFLAEVKVKEQQLEKLKSQAKIKGKRVANLSKKLQELETKNKKLAEEIEERERERFAGLNHYSLENVVRAVGKAIHDFAKPLIALMKHSDWDLDQAAYAIQSSVVYAKRSHKKYAFEAYIARRMFQGFLQQPCFLGNIMKLDDPIVALIEDPQSSFAKFCRAKYMLVVHPRMEESFFGNLDHRNFVANGIHPYTPLYRAFVRMARCVWYLQALIAYIEPEAEIFGVKQGTEFSDVYMEVVDELKEYKTMDNDHQRYKVEFMVMPGFMLRGALIRSQVYASKGEFSNGRL